MTRFMLIVSACLLAVPLACGKSETKPATPAAKAPAASAPATKAPAAETKAADATGAAAPAAAPAAAVAAAPVNANCPIEGGAVKANGGSVTFKAHTVGFCCPECVAKFEALDDAGKVAALAKNGTKLPE